ncbi:MAG: ABC transporter permease, partial [Candidatus Omnitrophica bacterium]|nr:ABC transporter permease [Candidatus Omnitrophota bacterium]
ADRHIKTIEDLAVYAPEMRIGGDYEFFGRPEWTSLEEAYDLKFSEQKSLDSTLMYQALVEGQVDVISAFSSDGRIAAFNLTVLEDPKQALPPYDAILLLSSKAARDKDLVEALRPLVGAIGDQAMREANKIVDVDKGSIAEAANFLSSGIEEPKKARD